MPSTTTTTTTTEEKIQTATDIAASIIGITTAVLGHPEIMLIGQLALKFGPQLALGFAKLFEKKTVTVEDVEAAFAQLKPYSAYGIPDKIDTDPSVPPVPTPTPTQPPAP